MSPQDKDRAFPAAPCATLPKNRGSGRYAFYFVLLFIGLFLFAFPLKALIAMSLKSQLYNYIPAIYFLSAYFLVSERGRIFSHSRHAFGCGLSVVSLSAAAAVTGLLLGARLAPGDYLCIMAVSFWLYLTGAFITCFGLEAFSKASFPLALLLLTVPLPSRLLSVIIVLLKTCSYKTAAWLFHLLGLFPVEQGFTFSFPPISIKVANACSGIHSCLSLVITALLGGHLFLRSKLNRVWLILCAVLIATFNNAVRIVALTLAALYIDPDILSTAWHRYAGIPVFALAFAWLAMIVLFMQKMERRKIAPRAREGGVD